MGPRPGLLLPPAPRSGGAACWFYSGLTGFPSCPLRACGFTFWTKKLPSLLSGPSLVSSVLSSR